MIAVIVLMVSVLALYYMHILDEKEKVARLKRKIGCYDREDQ